MLLAKLLNRAWRWVNPGETHDRCAGEAEEEQFTRYISEFTQFFPPNDAFWVIICLSSELHFLNCRNITQSCGATLDRSDISDCDRTTRAGRVRVAWEVSLLLPTLPQENIR